MKKAFIVTSYINAENTAPLTYSANRTFFSKEERLRHTIMTIASLDKAGDDETFIYLVDISDNWEEYKNLFWFQRNLKFVSVKNEFPEIYEEVRTHPNKSHCECLILATFMRAYKEDLRQYDFQFKMSGRYFLDSSFNLNHCTEENSNKIFFKKPLAFEWNDSWGYDILDRRDIQGDNKLRQYCPVLFCWSKPYQDKFCDMFTAIAYILTQPKMINMDIETLGYFFTRPYEEDIIETDWLVYGFVGTDGQFWRY